MGKWGMMGGALFAIVGGVFAMKYFLRSDSSIIEARVRDVLPLAATSEELTEIERLTQAKKLGSFFSETATVKLSGIEGQSDLVTGRGPLIEAVNAIWTHYRRLEFDLKGLELKMNGPSSATTYLTLGLKVAGTVMDTATVKVDWSKEKGNWGISHAEATGALDRSSIAEAPKSEEGSPDSPKRELNSAPSAPAPVSPD